MITFGFGYPKEQIANENLSQIYQFMSVAEMKDLIQRLGLPVRKSQRKDALAEAIDLVLKEHPEMVFNKLSDAEISLLQRLMNGERIVGAPSVLENFYLLCFIGWIGLWEVAPFIKSPLACELVLLKEAEEILRPFMQTYKPSRSRQIHRFLEGWSALCGIIPLHDALSYLHKQKGFEDVDMFELRAAILQYGQKDDYLHYADMKEGENEFYMTTWRNVTEKCPTLYVDTEMYEGKKVTVCAEHPKKFSFAEIMAASVPLFAPVTPNTKERDKLIKVYRREKLNDDIIGHVLLNCWCKKQSQETYNFSEELELLMATSFDQVNVALAALTDYMNTLPFWKFMGKSSKEIFLRKS